MRNHIVTAIVITVAIVVALIVTGLSLWLLNLGSIAGACIASVISFCVTFGLLRWRSHRQERKRKG